MDILEEIKKSKKDLKNLEAKAQQYCATKTNPLEDRWKFLLECGIANKSYRTNFGLDRKDSFLYEGPLYMDKYEIYCVDDMLHDLKEDEDFNLTEEEETVFKEYCCSKFISEMQFDW